MRALYTLLFVLLLPFAVLRLYWRSIKAPAYRDRIKERFARVPDRQSHKPLIWVHAVSVGETLAAVPMIRALQALLPDHAVCITTTTPTGSARVLAEFGESVLHYYLPYDLPSFQRHFSKAINPTVLIIMETELWPNMIAENAKSIPVILANGRMSEKSKKGYQSLSRLTRPMFEQLSLVAAQSNDDADRFLQLGANSSNCAITGSIKYDVKITDAHRDRMIDLSDCLQINRRRVIIFASTHSGEDELILPLIKRLQLRDERVLGFIVPRHPERFDTVRQLAQRHAMSLTTVTEGQSVSETTHLLLGDTMGDLLSFYGLADIAFIGGSLVPHGGHNMLEAAAWSLPTVMGSSFFNFKHIADRLMQEGGLVSVSDDFALERQLVTWLEQPSQAIKVGQRANQVLMANQGSLTNLVDRIVQQVDKCAG